MSEDLTEQDVEVLFDATKARPTLINFTKQQKKFCEYLVVASRLATEKRYDLILKDLAINEANPCMKCGSVQCAICSEDLKKRLQNIGASKLRTEKEIKHELENTKNWISTNADNVGQLIGFAKALSWVLGITPKALREKYKNRRKKP